MAEYSKLAMGNFISSANYQVVNLPFVPDQVQVWNLSGIDRVSNGTPAYGYWNKYMVQGGGSGWLNTVFGTTPAVTSLASVNYFPGGISTFEAGLQFSFGPQEAIASISKANPAVVTTAANHGYATGQVVMFQGITGMQQIAGTPFQITVTGATTFTIPWNTNQSSYTAISGSPAGAFVKAINYPFLYAPGVSFISAIVLGSTTTVTTTAPNNFVVGQEVAFRIPPLWGTVQLNSLPNERIPGSPLYGYVVSVTSPTVFVVNINSSAFSAFNSNILTTSVSGLTPAQVLAVGDVNTGGLQISAGSPLYPSPMVNGVSTINGPAILGSFVNNTSRGFVIGSGLIGPNSNQAIAWEATLHDYSVGVPLISNP